MRFTVRRPPSGEVSPCSHRPPGGDITCSVHVGVAWTSRADLALEDRLALAVSRSDMSARGTSLRRIRGRDKLDAAIGLVLQTSGQHPPATTADGAVQPTFLCDARTRLVGSATRRAGHRANIEILHPNQVEPPREVGSCLLHPILTPISAASLQLRGRVFGLFSAVGTPSGSGKTSLQHLQSLSLTRSQAWYVQELAGRERGRHGDSTVDTDHTSFTRTTDWVGDVSECDVPAANPISGDSVRLHTARHRSRQPHSYPPHLGHPHSTKVAVHALDVMRLHRDLPKPFVDSGLAPCWAPVRTVKEICHSLREVPQRLLLHRLTPGSKPRILGARLGELCALSSVSRSSSTRLPVLLLLDCKVPHISRVPAMRQECLLLLRSRHQAKSRHTRTITTDTDSTRLGALALHSLRRFQ